MSSRAPQVPASLPSDSMRLCHQPTPEMAVWGHDGSATCAYVCTHSAYSCTTNNPARLELDVSRWGWRRGHPPHTTVLSTVPVCHGHPASCLPLGSCLPHLAANTPGSIHPQGLPTFKAKRALTSGQSRCQPEGHGGERIQRVSWRATSPFVPCVWWGGRGASASPMSELLISYLGSWLLWVGKF